jgi:hypothetical protein
MRRAIAQMVVKECVVKIISVNDEMLRKTGEFELAMMLAVP